jgi:hypothetical protein
MKRTQTDQLLTADSEVQTLDDRAPTLDVGAQAEVDTHTQGTQHEKPAQKHTNTQVVLEILKRQLDSDFT